MDIKELGGRFVLGEELARRAACIVYRAQDKTLGGREVAVKMFLDKPEGNEELITSFENDVAMLRSATHPALVPIVAGGHDQGMFYLAMEYIQGRNLRDMLKEANGPLDQDRCVQIIAELAQGLHEIHEKGAVHGHLDSRAVLFKGEEARLAGYHPTVIDRIQKQSTSVARVVADPACISPEQLSGSDQIDRRADIYALSILLFHMVTGERPFNAANPLQAAMLRVTQPPPSPFKVNQSISPLLDAAILKGLARDPKDRFRNCLEFVDAITGGRKAAKSPLQEQQPAMGGGRIGTETIAVSMSTDAIKEMLKKYEKEQAPASTPPPSESVTGTAMSAKALPGGQLDVASTVMGVSTAGLLKGSFIAVDPELRGKKYTLDRPQMMIGSDPGCNVCVSGRGVPQRYAIVLQKGDKYFAAPLSPTPLTINDVQQKGSDEIELKRGDILKVGNHQLRFVAPGEVFTLKDAVADRVIDRPKSRAKAYLVAGLAAVCALLIIASVISQQRDEARRRAESALRAKKDAERAELIKVLTKEGDELFKAGSYVEPVAGNAQDKFRQILAVSPENSYAKRRLAEIDERLQAMAKEREHREQFAARIAQLANEAEGYFRNKNFVSPPGRNAKETYNEILKLDPANELAKNRIAEIDTAMRDFLARVNGMLASARSFIDQGQFIAPQGANAFEIVKEVLAIDPNNGDATSMLYDMAARSIFKGDIHKQKAQPEEARKAYLTAQVLGVDPNMINERMRGLDLIKRSTAGVIIYGAGADKPKQSLPSGAGYLSAAEIDKRLANLNLERQVAGEKGDRAFIELRRPQQ